ncbi:hypothetical protein ACIBTZ_11500 [Micromonospora sp. NPDC049460]|uniref:hypothetical protein n=1 Tax=Micromonospora sp. NPDC049460 TaxID=3364272 RepID=UPI0037876701
MPRGSSPSSLPAVDPPPGERAARLARHRALLRAVQITAETHGGILFHPYPKSRAGVRTVPLPGFLLAALRQLRTEAGDLDPRTLVVRDRIGCPLRRSIFRRRVWLPSLVPAASTAGHPCQIPVCIGLLGQVVNTGPINLVQRVIGHKQASTTLNRYTHTRTDYAARILAAFDSSAASLLPPAEDSPSERGLGEDRDGL